MIESEASPRAFVVRGAGIASADSSNLQIADIAVEDGVITRIGADIGEIPGALVLDGVGKVLLPGLFDMHVYLREPGEEWK
jgi:dihydroorotase